MIGYKEFTIEKFGVKPVEIKSYKDKDGKEGTYPAVPIVYDYTDYSKYPGKTPDQLTEKELRVSRLKIKLPTMYTSTQGVKSGQYGFSMMLILDKNDPEMIRVMEILDEIYQQCLTVLDKNRKVFKMDPKWKPENHTGDPKPFYYIPLDDAGEVVPDKSPTMWVDINTDTKPQVSKDGKTYYNYSLFTSPGGKEISYAELQNCKMKLQPVVQIDRISKGAKISIRPSLTAAVVLEAKPSGGDATRTEKLLRNMNLGEMTPEEIESIERQLALLKERSSIKQEQTVDDSQAGESPSRSDQDAGGAAADSGDIVAAIDAAPATEPASSEPQKKNPPKMLKIAKKTPTSELDKLVA